MKRLDQRKRHMVDAGWFSSTSFINVYIKGRVRSVETIKWYHPEKQPTPISFSLAFNIEFPADTHQAKLFIR